MQQARAYLAECDRVQALLAPLSEADYAQETQFKAWTINEIVQHLLFFDRLCGLTVSDPARFERGYAALNALREKGMTLTEATDHLLEGLRGSALRAAWVQGSQELAELFARTDPKARLQWVGPQMSARSSITARLMEVWSHAQAIYDLRGVQRVNTDGIANIVRLGVNTFGWTFINRAEPVPEMMPLLRLRAPSGALWSYGDAQSCESIEGLAEEFCMVVTQTRNIADTALQVRGASAQRWMEVAQCFAGPARTPPAPGQRFCCNRVSPCEPKAPALANSAKRVSS